jgi:hypothetical protein
MLYTYGIFVKRGHPGWFYRGPDGCWKFHRYLKPDELVALGVMPCSNCKCTERDGHYFVHTRLTVELNERPL